MNHTPKVNFYRISMPTFDHRMITRSFNVVQRFVIKSLLRRDHGSETIPPLTVREGCSIRKRRFLAFLSGLLLAGLPTFPVQAQTPPPKVTPQAPPSVLQVTIQDLSRRLKIPAQQIRVQKSQAQTWPNGCLGLGKPEELCTQALVPGWQVILRQGKKTWTYRTNQTGSQLRLESSQAVKSP